MWPALVASELSQIATETTRPGAPKRQARWTNIRLGALAGRLMFPGGLTAASRHAGAEPMWTGRPRPYDESTLRRRARRLERSGAVGIVSRVLERQVECAVKASGAPAVAHTDMYDQVHWSKQLAHAAPIGGLGHRLLGAVYFGLTTVRLTGDNNDVGPALSYHVSWHKPASPLVDALKELHGDSLRHAWLTTHVRLHVWDRGGNGVAVLSWAREMQIPYLTVRNGWVYLSSQKTPTLTTPEALPIFVRRDVRLPISTGRDEPAARVVIFPARRDKGEECKRGLRYSTNAALTLDELATLDETYKTRWPTMENQIKGYVAVGFGVNRDRTLELTTSRGLDGQLARSVEREAKLMSDIDRAREQPLNDKRFATAIAAVAKIGKERGTRQRLSDNRVEKGARASGHGELLCKNLILLIHNALAMLLAKSAIAEVRAMTCQRVRELLLAKPALGLIEPNCVTLYIEEVADAAQRPLQNELARLLNEFVELRMPDGTRLLLRLTQRHGTTRR